MHGVCFAYCEKCHTKTMKQKVLVIVSFIPLIVLMGVAYIAPIVSNIIMSFQNDDGEFVGIDNYVSVYTSYYFLDSLLFTLRVALLATIISMVIAVVVALALRETFIGKRLVVLMFQFNLTVPRMAAAMMIMLLLSQTGALSKIAYSLGLIDSASSFPWLIHDQGGWGLVFTFAWKFFPYIGMSVLGVLQGASREYENQAAVLGVGRFKRFWHVTLPLIIPATSIASIIVFSAAFGDYEIPMILGDSSNDMLSVLTYTKYTDIDLMDKPASYVLMITMMVILIVVILVYRRFTVQEEVARR